MIENSACKSFNPFAAKPKLFIPILILSVISYKNHAISWLGSDK